MATTAINTSSSNSSKKAMVADAAKVAMAVGAGAVAGAVGDDILTGEPEPIVEPITAEEQTAEATAAAVEEQTETAEQTTAQPTHSAQPTQTSATHTEGPQPVSSASGSTTQTTQAAQPTQTAQAEQTTTTAQSEDDALDAIDAESGYVDPNLIAQEIISGEEIDPEDIDAENVVNFAEVGTIYGSDGHEYQAAVMTDPTGAEMVVVDIDDDNEYDVVIDDNGNMVCEMPGHINTTDAELAINNTPTYMAQNENDIPQTGLEDMMQDIITT